METSVMGYIVIHSLDRDISPYNGESNGKEHGK